MKRQLLLPACAALLLTAMLSVPGHAQSVHSSESGFATASDSADKVPFREWPWTAAATLAQAKIPFGDMGEAVYYGTRPLTRRQFSSFTAQLLSVLSRDEDESGRALAQRLERNPAALNALVALGDAFPMAKTGPAQSVAYSRLLALQAKVRLDIYQKKRTVKKNLSVGPFADVPTSSPAYEQLDALQKWGVVIGYPGRESDGRPAATRFDFGVVLSRFLFMLHPLPAETGTPDEVRHLVQEQQIILRRHSQALSALTALVSQFAGDLEFLHQNVRIARVNIATLARTAFADPNAEVPPEDPAYVDLDTLTSAGLVLDLYEGGASYSRHVPRGNFAKAIARFVPLLLLPGEGTPASEASGMEAVRQDLKHKIDERREALTALRRLVIEFRPELQALGQNVVATLARMNELHFFDRVPAQDPAYQDVTTLVLAGLGSDPYGFYAGWRDDATPYQFAVITAQFLNIASPSAAERTAAGHADDGIGGDVPKARRVLRSDPQAHAALARLAEEFAPLLKRFKLDPVTVRTRLAALASGIPLPAAVPFPDVQSEHWASQPIEKVHQAGILVGYPDGAFLTDDSQN